MNFPYSRRQVRRLLDEAQARLNGRPATTLSGQDFEELDRIAFGGVIPTNQRVSGDIDTWDGKGNGSSCKTIIVNERVARSRIWPEAIGRRRVAMPADIDHSEAQTGEPVLIEVEHSRYSPRIRRLLQLIDGDPQTAGNHILRQLRDALERSCEERGVRTPTYKLIVRHPDGRRLALAIKPLELPEPSELTWRWQIEDETDPEAEPTSLEAFHADGQLWGRWYIKGGQIRRLLVIDASQMARMRLPGSAR